MFSLKTVLVLTSSLALAFAEGPPVIANKYTDSLCLTHIHNPVHSGECIELGGQGASDCEGFGYPVIQPAKCVNLAQGHGSVRCFAHDDDDEDEDDDDEEDD
ncbi:hypothetical protein N8T08_010191 [Aspergillus melleus]|uniref:Uncharacterized protein n=1 Tax=Aspergillus melleus TaxID=138277 RepID=A0ACC3BCQ9_9EURO|nr:hypothetical protein N8T08_010191 [Aspergillus melleus]